MNNNQKQIAPLETITASTLMNTQFDPLSFSIEKLLPQGILSLQAVAKSASHGLRWICVLLQQLGVNCGTTTLFAAMFCTLP